MDYGMYEIIFFVGKTTIALALVLLICYLLRESNPRWQVQICRLTSILILSCGLLSASPLSNVWGPSLARPDISLPSGSLAPSPGNNGPVLPSSANKIATIVSPSETDLQVRIPAGPFDQRDALEVAVDPSRDSRPASSSEFSHGETGLQYEQRSVETSAGFDWSLVSRQLFSIWGAVAILLASLRLLAIYQVHRVVRRSSPLPQEIAVVLGAENLVQPRLSKDVASPSVIGCLQPTVLLPTWMCQDGRFAEHDVRAAWAHELAHIRNSDPLWIPLFDWLCIVLWFHPLMYWLKAAHRSACERVADCDAATSVGDVKLYAASLARVALRVFESPSVSGAGVAMIAMVSRFSTRRSSVIVKRLRSLRESRPSQPLGRRRFGVALGAYLAAVTMGTLGIVETPIGAAPPLAENRGGDVTPTTSEQTELVVPDGVEPSVQNPSVEEPPKQEAAAPPTLSRKSVYDAFAHAPTLVPAEGEPRRLVNATGVVIDTSGRVQPGVHVALMAIDKRVNKSFEPTFPIVAHTSTNAEGAFAFVNVASVQEEFVQDSECQWWIVAVSRDGKIGWVSVESSEQPAEIKQDVVLNEGTQFEGQIVDEDGQPLAGGKIQATYSARVADIPNNNGRRTDLQQDLFLYEANLVATADAGGNFAIEGLPANSLIVFRICHPNVADKRIMVATTDDPNEIDMIQVSLDQPVLLRKSGEVIVCEAGTLITGKVVDEAGEPVESTIHVRAGGQSLTAETADGKFRLRLAAGDAAHPSRVTNTNQPSVNSVYVLPSDRNRHMISIAGYSDQELAALASLDFVLHRKFECSGRIVDSAGQGVGGVGVLVGKRAAFGNSHPAVGPRESLRAIARATSDTGGNFKVYLPEGNVEFLLSGRVPGYDLVQGDHYVDEHGQLWEWPGNMNGSHSAVIRAANQHINDMVVGSTEPVSVRVIGPSGQPLAGAEVSLLASPGMTGTKKKSQEERHMVAIAEPATTDAAGLCCINPFAQPDYTAMFKVVFKDSQRPMLAKFPLENFLNVVEELRRGVVIRAQPALHIRGRVTVEGQPLDKVWIDIGPSTSRYVAHVDSLGQRTRRLQISQLGRQPLTVQTNSAGIYEAWVDAYESRWSTALHAGIPNERRPRSAQLVEYLDAFYAQGDIELKRGPHTLHGRVIDQDGSPISKARISVERTEEFEPSTMFNATRVLTRLDGTFTIEGLPNPGQYALSVSVPYPTKGSRPISTKSEFVAASTAQSSTITVNLERLQQR